MPPDSYYETNTRHGVDERIRVAIERLVDIRKELQFLPVKFWGTELPKSSQEALKAVNALGDLSDKAGGRFEVEQAELTLAKWRDQL